MKELNVNMKTIVIILLISLCIGCVNITEENAYDRVEKLDEESKEIYAEMRDNQESFSASEIERDEYFNQLWVIYGKLIINTEKRIEAIEENQKLGYYNETYDKEYLRMIKNNVEGLKKNQLFIHDRLR